MFTLSPGSWSASWATRASAVATCGAVDRGDRVAECQAGSAAPVPASTCSTATPPLPSAAPIPRYAEGPIWTSPDSLPDSIWSTIDIASPIGTAKLSALEALAAAAEPLVLEAAVLMPTTSPSSSYIGPPL